ncbi:MAG: twin-arginine translocase subunit TatB [Rhizobiales bacterium]|nr:twin-arginine translocase subunit TatB [Hyphomicrobiales bacterium]
MLDISWSELLLVGVVALIVIGPKELPGALRTLGQWMAKIRRMAAEFQGQFQEAMREAEIDQLKKDMDEMADKAKDFTKFDELDDVRRDIEKSVGDLPPLDQPSATKPPAQPADAQTATAALPQPSDDAAATAASPSPPAEPAPPAAPAEPDPAVADVKPAAGRAPA